MPKTFYKKTLNYFLVSTIVALTACGSDGSSNAIGGPGPSNPNQPGTGTGTRSSFCGAVNQGQMQNPPVLNQSQEVSIVSALDSNFVLVKRDTEEFLVKLQALSDTSSFNNTAAKKTINKLAAQEKIYFVEAGDCQATSASIAGSAKVGQLFTASGKSFSEEIFKNLQGGSLINDGCKSNEIAPCYQAITEQSANARINGQSSNEDTDSEEEQNNDNETPTDGNSSNLQVSNFLWKPESESAYNPGGLSILLNPCNVNVFVNGSQVREYPTGNGRCVTVRSTATGCAFGNNVKVEVFTKNTNSRVFFGNQPHIIIPNGCDRLEYVGSSNSSSNSVNNNNNNNVIVRNSSTTAPSCTKAPLSVQYRPSLTDCSGNAAVILSGAYLRAFSVQLRLPDGGDRLDPECELSSCSPYKVQKYLSLGGRKVACFGARGDANLMSIIQHVSIKMTGTDSNPARFCIPSPEQNLN